MGEWLHERQPDGSHLAVRATDALLDELGDLYRKRADTLLLIDEWIIQVPQWAPALEQLRLRLL